MILPICLDRLEACRIIQVSASSVLLYTFKGWYNRSDNVLHKFSYAEPTSQYDRFPMWNMFTCILQDVVWCIIGYVRLVTYFFKKCVVVWNWSPCYDLIHTYRISERDEPRRSLSVVLIDTPLSYRSKTMVTLLNANDAFPRSRTSRLWITYNC